MKKNSQQPFVEKNNFIFLRKSNVHAILKQPSVQNRFIYTLQSTCRRHNFGENHERRIVTTNNDTTLHYTTTILLCDEFTIYDTAKHN